MIIKNLDHIILLLKQKVKKKKDMKTMTKSTLIVTEPRPLPQHWIKDIITVDIDNIDEIEKLVERLNHQATSTSLTTIATNNAIEDTNNIVVNKKMSI